MAAALGHEPAPAERPAFEHGPALVGGMPSAQQAVDLFKGEWISGFPAAGPPLLAGAMPLFDDPRVLWALERLGGVSGQRVLELGPLEGGHSYIAQQQGAREVIAIEGNARAFMKCLIAKEVLGLDRVHYLLGDFITYMRDSGEQFDTCFANGVLYHMTEPAMVVHLMARVARRAVIWTHYYDAQRVPGSGSAQRFAGASSAEFEGFRYTQHRFEYGHLLQQATFAGGLVPHAHWMTRDDLLACLRHAGFTSIEIGSEEPDHPVGPCFTLAVSR